MTRYKVTNSNHPHFGMTGELANDPDFPMRTFVHFPPMIALRLDNPNLGTTVVYVDKGDIEGIED